MTPKEIFNFMLGYITSKDEAIAIQIKDMLNECKGWKELS